MEKNDLLKQIAQKGYDIGFGAKKHLATYDIVCKAPGLIGFLSISIGIVTLVFEISSFEIVPVFLIILGLTIPHVNLYNETKETYNNAGKEITKLFDKVKILYFELKSENANTEKIKADLQTIINEYHNISISKQIIFSDWYAHYKFFRQMQIGWIEEQISFTFLRDKIPLPLSIIGILLIFIVVFYFSELKTFFCSII